MVNIKQKLCPGNIEKMLPGQHWSQRATANIGLINQIVAKNSEV